MPPSHCKARIFYKPADPVRNKQLQVSKSAGRGRSRLKGAPLAAF